MLAVAEAAVADQVVELAEPLDDAFGIDMPEGELAVITSYSIHYTKLYDVGEQAEGLQATFETAHIAVDQA